MSRAASIIRFINILCHMQHRAKCKCMLRLIMAGDYVGLHCSEYRHHADNQAQDDTKKLKYDQMIAIREEVITVPQGTCFYTTVVSRRFCQSICAASGIRFTVPAERYVPNNSREMKSMTPMASCKQKTGGI
jgi:hypothetical protein